MNYIVNLTCNKLLFFFARPRLLAGHCRVTVFPNCVPLLGFTFGRFHDTGSGRGLGAAGDSGARPLHFWLGRALIQSKVSSLSHVRNFAILHWRFGVYWRLAIGLFTFKVFRQCKNRFGFSLKFGHRLEERFIFYQFKATSQTGRLDEKCVGNGFQRFSLMSCPYWLIA